MPTPSTAPFEEFGPDHVVHAAASYKDPDNWAEDARTNVEGGVNVVRASQTRRRRSRSCTSRPRCATGRDRSSSRSRSAHPIRPDSSYAISKTAAEQYIELSGLDFVSFRLANAYGPRNISGPLPTFFQRLTAGQAVLRDGHAPRFHLRRGSRRRGRARARRRGQRATTTSRRARTTRSRSCSTRPSTRCRSSSRRRSRSGRATPTTRTRSCWIPRARTRTSPAGAFRRRCRKALPTRSAYYREHGIDETFTHLKDLEPEKVKDRA